tara:strand:- start:1551 stop:1802 length:252 start_codon:yes stop_codon:yes gene_type:complete
MKKINEINLIEIPIKDQLLKINEILDDLCSSNGGIGNCSKTKILTADELLVKYIPPKAVEKKIKIKFKYVDDIWHITLEKEQK